MNELATRECIPCKGGIPPLAGKELAELLDMLGSQWEIREGKKLTKEYKFKNFRDALTFTNRVGELAETVGHHPDIHLSWGRVRLDIWTHKIGGLTESDFVLAAKVEELYE
jgi:4a-hydroxytetrahydrobiopterin dehydratase